MDYEIIIGTQVENNEHLAIAEATSIVKEAIPDASVWNVDVYDEGAGIGLNVDTEREDVEVEDCDAFESVQEVSVTKI